MKKKQAIIYDYVSDTDKYLEKLHKEGKLSASQQKEIAKHERIARLRDQPQEQAPDSGIWKDF